MCSCRSGAKTAPIAHVVVLPGGKQKAYSSPITAEAEAKRIPGAYVKPQPAATI